MMHRMSETQDNAGDAANIFTEMLRMQGEAARQMVQGLLPEAGAVMPDEETLEEWGRSAARIQQMWLDHRETSDAPDLVTSLFADPEQWMAAIRGIYHQMPWLDLQRQQQIWDEGLALWTDILGQFGIAPGGEGEPATDPVLPRSDRRFADPAWRERPVYALIHQTYLLLAERIGEAVESIDGLEKQEREQLRFATRSVLDAMSPSNFVLMNPVVLERTIETHGANLARGMERLTADLERGQLTHSDESVFRLGENIACTPGKVVHETPLYQIIQYSPATEEIYAVPLVIFPPWINRFYILDLNPKKSFVRWAVEQGLTVFMVSWRSADESMADIEWDDYIAAQMPLGWPSPPCRPATPR